jgi:hypothetical protein
MTKDQDARFGRPRMGERCPEAITEAHATGYVFDARAHDGEVTRDKPHHAVYRPGIPRGALALNPRSQTLGHFFAIKGQSVHVHCCCSSGFRSPAIWQVAISKLRAAFRREGVMVRLRVHPLRLPGIDEIY